jgi:hypothetical protein
MSTLAFSVLSLLLAGSASPKTLLVAPVKRVKTDASDAKTLTDLIRSFAGAHGTYTLVTPEDLAAIDEELLRQLSGGCDDASCISEVGGALGAHYMISGSFNRMGSRYILTLKLVDIETVRQIRSVVVQARSGDGVIDALELKVRELVTGVKAPGAAPQAQPSPRPEAQAPMPVRPDVPPRGAKSKTSGVPPVDEWTVSVFNIDDHAAIYANGKKIHQCEFSRSCTIKLNPHLKPGRNKVRLDYSNRAMFWTYGYKVLKNDEVMYTGRCGQVWVFGCSWNISLGVVHSFEFEIEKPHRDASAARSGQRK